MIFIEEFLSSNLSVSVKPSMANLVALYAPRPSIAVNPSIDEQLIIRP